MYKFKVTFNVKHISKKSALFGLVSFDQTCKFPTLQSAMDYARRMKGHRNSKIEVIGMPTIERI